MSMLSSRRWLLMAALAGLVLLAGAAWFWWPIQTPAPVPRVLLLPDGVQAFYKTDSRLEPAPGYPVPRELRIDGDFFIRVPEASAPLIVRSRLLVLTITGRTAFRITAFSLEAGEQVEVLDGHIEARKSYPSNYAEPDQLAAGEMTMINRDIDLMEKETTDLAALRAWSEALVASVAARPSATSR
jgi:hypothetical protein